MVSLDEVLAAMPDEASVLYEFLTIDAEKRRILVPEAEEIFGVEADEVAERKYFRCPRYVGDNLDLAGMFLTVYFRNANGEEDGYLVDDVAVDGDDITFSWLLSEKVTAYKGQIQFSVCADLPNTETKRRPDWNTTLASGTVLEGLDPDVGDVEAGSSDVLTQLRETVQAQTAAVEAVGAAQIDAVEAAGANATQEAKDAVKAQGEATLATIPEDYTALAGKVNEQANAIKGQLSGAVIRADDVSPVEHYPVVRVHGKNLFNTGKFEPAEDQTASIYVSAVETGAITLYCSADHNGYYSTGLRLREVCPGLEAEKTYTLSAVTEATGRGYMYLHGANVTWWYGTPQKVTEEMLDSVMVLYSINGHNYGAAYCTISNIQMEEGTVATEYEPYIDPAGVTVTRCGKNLLKYPFTSPTKQYPGVAFTDNGDGTFMVNGTATAECVHFLLDGENIPINGKCTFSGISGGSATTYYVQPVVDGVYKDIITDPATVEINGCLNRIGFYIKRGTTVENMTIKLQVELGDTVTVYEPYNGATAMPAADGTVGGLTSLAPTMTLLADTPGVALDCTYNRDTNAVLAEILERLTALGG